jgi:hypothetical protein
MITSCARNLIILYLCCIVASWSGYLTQTFDCTLVKVLHCSLIRWERRATASQDHLALAGQLIWRQHSIPRLHHRLTLRTPSGTLGMWVATLVTKRVVGTTPLMVTPSLDSVPKPSPLPGTLTGTLVWSGTLVMGFTSWVRGGRDWTTRVTDGGLCTCANGDASLHRLTDQHDAWPLRSL